MITFEEFLKAPANHEIGRVYICQATHERLYEDFLVVYKNDWQEEPELALVSYTGRIEEVLHGSSAVGADKLLKHYCARHTFRIERTVNAILREEGGCGPLEQQARQDHIEKTLCETILDQVEALLKK